MKLFFAVLGLLLLAGVGGSARVHLFTVRDSIEMTRFLRDDPGVQFSPDNRYFAIVTSRGIMQSNSIESTLWVFSVAQIQAFLRPGSEAKPPVPRVAAKITAVPHTDYSTSYEPVIFTFQWLPDSKGILFQAQGAQGERRLYRADLTSGSVHGLTPSGEDVTQFTYSPSALVYETTPLYVSPLQGEPINADVTDLTDVPLDVIFFPQAHKDNIARNDLWILRNGKTRKITDRGRSLRLSNAVDALTIAPDGHEVVALVPVDIFPNSWVQFEPAFPFPWLRIQPQGLKKTDLIEYALINADTGKMTPLVRAPNAWSFGWSYPNGAVWSPSGATVLLRDTFLPLDGVNTAEQTRRRYPCIAAVVDTRSKATNCLAFGSHDNSVADGDYHYEDGMWKFSKSVAKNSQPFSVVVKQNLNTPPALWVTDPRTQATKKLWDPNPQLAAIKLGEASVFRWKDVTGHQWIGGLVKPPYYIQGKRYPLVIQTHGFLANEFVTDGIYTTAFAARPLADSGILVLQMPMDFEHVATAEEVPDQLRGFESAVAQLDAAGLIDPKNVGVIGFSRTSWYVESALIQDPQLFAAAAIGEGNDESYMQCLLWPEGGCSDEKKIYGASPFGEGLSTWLKEAPDFHLDRVQAPLLIQAIGDSGGIAQEWERYVLLRMQNKPVDLMYIRHGQHILQKPLSRLASQQSTVDWFRFWLKDEEDSDPAKSAQYARWRKLRELTLHPTVK